MRNPGPKGRRAGTGTERGAGTGTEQEAWGDKEAKIAIPAEADEAAKERKWNKFTELTEARIEPCSHFFSTETLLSSLFHKYRNKTFK